MEIQVNLKRFRQEKNLTQAAAAETIGIDQRQWNRYENGKNDIPVRYLKAICTKFKTSADWILEIEEETGNKSTQKIIEEIYEDIFYSILGSCNEVDDKEDFIGIIKDTLHYDMNRMIQKYCRKE